MSLETRDGGWIGHAVMERVGDAKRCGPMEVRRGDFAGGRLTGWLAP
ncbi:MAG: hypothetical protein QFF03_11490 [Pseudomonadota bacterium]|nr:hypothetical protein [Pseudomonadota bacterium]